MSRAEELKCPRCGAPILLTDTECMNCGAELDHGRLVEDQTSQAPGVAVEHGIAEVVTPDVEYRTFPGAADWDSVPLGGGFFASLSRSWKFFLACVKMLSGYPLMLVPPLMGIFVSLAILASAFVVLKLTGLWDQWMQSDNDKTPWGVWAVLAPFILLSYMALLSVMGMVAHMVDAYLRGRRATLGQALADVIKNAPALFYLAVINLVVSLLLSAVRSKSRGWATRAATGAAERAREVVNSLLVPVIMLEDKPLRAASERAWALFRKRALDVIVAELGLLVLNRVVAFVTVLLVGAMLAGAILVAQALLPVAIAAAAGLIILTVAFTSFVRMAYYTCLYLWAAAMEAMGSEKVPAPEPIARALAA
ncbi:MAG: zinc ribbon domain-containing protein [Armatimonadetes bacterium]|nr:zinc ribbon domain-containing protein [Armatimonadota bacterium]